MQLPEWMSFQDKKENYKFSSGYCDDCKSVPHKPQSWYFLNNLLNISSHLGPKWKPYEPFESDANSKRRPYIYSGLPRGAATALHVLTYVRVPPRWRRVHAFTARGVILEHAVRCRACFTLPATPASPPPPPETHADSPPSRRHRFIYLFICSFFFITATYGNGWRRLLQQSVCICIRMRAHVHVWAWSRTSTWGGRGPEAGCGL